MPKCRKKNSPIASNAVAEYDQQGTPGQFLKRTISFSTAKVSHPARLRPREIVMMSVNTDGGRVG
ncbi:hypothetical protein DPV78_000242 [Talaromyces pinophilus]|nr:hypothetical protein DPV78_000242 [Talaromyces pinophilus]